MIEETLAVKTRDARGRFIRGVDVPGRGGSPGNLNGVRFPWRAFWARRALRPQDRWVRKIVSEHAGSLLSDKPEATEAELHLMEVAGVSRGCTALILDAMRRAGGIDTAEGLALIKELRGFLSLEQKVLISIGLERRAKVIDPMQAVRDAVTRANLPESDSE